MYVMALRLISYKKKLSYFFSFLVAYLIIDLILPEEKRKKIPVSDNHPIQPTDTFGVSIHEK
jgi:hypothetical protein